MAKYVSIYRKLFNNPIMFCVKKIESGSILLHVFPCIFMYLCEFPHASMIFHVFMYSLCSMFFGGIFCFQLVPCVHVFLSVYVSFHVFPCVFHVFKCVLMFFCDVQCISLCFHVFIYSITVLENHV